MFSLMIIWMLAMLPKNHNFLFHFNFLGLCSLLICCVIRCEVAFVYWLNFYRQCCSILHILNHWISYSAKPKEMAKKSLVHNFKLRVSKNVFEKLNKLHQHPNKNSHTNSVYVSAMIIKKLKWQVKNWLCKKKITIHKFLAIVLGLDFNNELKYQFTLKYWWFWK